MSLLALPVELLNTICNHLNNTDLLVLSRTSTTLSPIAQSLLYRVVAVSHTSRNLNLVLTLATHPHLALYVREFSIVVDTNTLVFRSFYCALACALSRMAELTSLNIRVDRRVSWILGLNPPAKPRLRHFTSSFMLDSHVATFLQHTPALEMLQLDSSAPPSKSSPPPTLPSSCLPRLVHFVGPCQAAKIIVPGRPVQSIHVYDANLTEDEVACFAQSTAPIAVLDAMTPSLVVPLLHSLAQHLPYLAYLRVAASPQSPNQPDSAFYEQVSSALTMMPDLAGFELSGTHWASFPVHERVNSFNNGASTSTSTGSKSGQRVWQVPAFTGNPVLPPDVAPPRDEYFEHFSDFGFNDFAFGF